ncbi:MAG TPA: IS481 family transposase, partial [Candidatus Dormibacteraeota bacterium]|nr:IS481 family transposase [Candidatus Dormibacteraeota bacterium]
MQHRPRLTPFGRLLLVQRVRELCWSPASAAEAVGVSRATVYKWLRRYRELGEPGLVDRPSRPHHCPHALAEPTVARILQARRRWRQGPHRLGPRLRLPRSTVYGVLRRHGVSRLADADRPTGIPIRYVRERPGELLHLDSKKLGQIPAGGGHRFLGRGGARGSRQKEGRGYDYLHVAVDDCSRVAFVQLAADETGPTAARFLLQAASFFAEQGVRIERVLTDRAFAYTVSGEFREAITRLQARHLVTRPYRPQTNGKAERFIRTLLQEWAYARFYGSNQERQRQLPRWVRFYNRYRPHTALGGQAPTSVLVNKADGNY